MLNYYPLAEKGEGIIVFFQNAHERHSFEQLLKYF